MSDLTDERLDQIATGDMSAGQFARMGNWEGSIVDDDELECLIVEIRRHRAMVRRLEAWAAEIETSSLPWSGGLIANELRNRMKGDGNG